MLIDKKERQRLLEALDNPSVNFNGPEAAAYIHRLEKEIAVLRTNLDLITRAVNAANAPRPAEILETELPPSELAKLPN